MPLPQPIPGLVVHYSYLWHDEKQRGLEEGIKDRPCVIVSAVQSTHDEIVIVVAPVTHSPPRSATDGVELPLSTKQRLMLDEARSWVVTNDLNRFYWPGPDLRPVPKQPIGTYAYGVLPPKFFTTIKTSVLRSAQNQTVRATQR